VLHVPSGRTPVVILAGDAPLVPMGSRYAGRPHRSGGHVGVAELADAL